MEKRKTLFVNLIEDKQISEDKQKVYSIKKINAKKSNVDYRFFYTDKNYLILIMVATNKKEIIEQVFLNGYGKYEGYIVTIKSDPDFVYAFHIALVDPKGNKIKKPWDRITMGRILKINKLEKCKKSYLLTKN